MEPETAYGIFSRALRQYFVEPAFETEMLLVLLFPALILVVYLFFSMQPRDPYPEIPQKDLDFFAMVCLQKGLESFDREMLLDLATTYNLQPVYKILLEEDAFARIQAKMAANIIGNDVNNEANRQLTYLRTLRPRIFSGETSSL